MSADRTLSVLHISSVYPPHVVGGGEKVVEMLAEAQAARGYRVGAAYPTRGDEEGERHGVHVLPQRDRNLIAIDDVMKRPRPMRTANKLYQMANVPAARDFGAAIDAFRPDIVHTHSMVELPPMVWRAAGKRGVPIVHTLHDYDLLCSRASLFRNGETCTTRHPSCWATSHWKARFAGRIQGVAAVSSAVLDLHRDYGFFADLQPDRARVVWNASPGAKGRQSAGRTVRTGDFTFGFLGRLVREKGLGVLIDACRLLPDTGWRLRIAGRASEGDAAWREQAEGLPIEFVGFADPGTFLDTIDTLVVPPIWREPFGLTVIEAFAHDVPVIGTRMGAIADLVGAIGDDWLVTPDDRTALAQRMCAVMAAGRGALPDHAAFAPVLEQVSLDRMIANYDDLYAAVLR